MRWLGFYSTEVYHPISMITDSLRDYFRRIGGKKDKRRQKTSLPRIHWKSAIQRKPIVLCELQKADGNVRISELGIICQFARSLKGTEPPQGEGLIFEIGTFDGRTTLNFALNAENYKIVTLDLPSKSQTELRVEPSEKKYIKKHISGERFIKNAARFPESVQKIRQLYGDSATFDYREFEGKCDMVFVDGSHSYEYLRKDSETAFRLRSKEGIIIWHDYGVWEGVTRGLEEIERETKIGLKHIAGTSLVILKQC